MKGPVDVAAAAAAGRNYAPFQMPVPVQVEGSVSQFQQKVLLDFVILLNAFSLLWVIFFMWISIGFESIKLSVLQKFGVFFLK